MSRAEKLSTHTEPTRSRESQRRAAAAWALSAKKTGKAAREALYAMGFGHPYNERAAATIERANRHAVAILQSEERSQ